MSKNKSNFFLKYIFLNFLIFLGKVPVKGANNVYYDNYDKGMEGPKKDQKNEG
jgi:hypothetical protein